MTFGSCSTKILRSQRELSHRKRRTVTAIATALPCHGRSASRRSYRLWTRCDRRSQAGHQADASRGFARIVIWSAAVRIWVTINSAGTSASMASMIDDPSVNHLSQRFAIRVQAQSAPRVRKSRDCVRNGGRASKRFDRSSVSTCSGVPCSRTFSHPFGTFSGIEISDTSRTRKSRLGFGVQRRLINT